MIRFFRNVRQKLLNINTFSKYLLYAIGEIILIVFGILIALQINNANEANKTRNKEVAYLRGIRTDLQLNTIEIERYLTVKESSIESANIVIDFFEGKPMRDLAYFNYHNLKVQIWNPYMYINNTYQELVNSGNFAIISDDSIKTLLLNLEADYQYIQFVEDHMYSDFKENIYHFYFGHTDINSHLQNYLFQITDGQAGENLKLSRRDFDAILENQRFKNGFVLSIFNNGLLIQKLKDMNEKIQQLIVLIDKDILK